ncbi:hypothetical protein COO16_04280 [Bacillus pseudomycoides]|uniref:hypothetical protein n=1 Tax=Bacillus pseudomycoides TaxID=64104 RepID=UPI000BEDDF9D|nr:hypothetical protein [Bacillus pseudomycoides]PDY14185.1 hypothetical protein COO16_04280 [Bacillus pseudomycoides]
MKSSKKSFDEIVKSFEGKVITINPDTTSLINPLDINLISQKEALREDAIKRISLFLEALTGCELTQQEENAVRKIIIENKNPERNVEEVLEELVNQKEKGAKGLSRLIGFYEDIVMKKFENE